jgi:hypothetical protein
MLVKGSRAVKHATGFDAGLGPAIRSIIFIVSDASAPVVDA